MTSTVHKMRAIVLPILVAIVGSQLALADPTMQARRQVHFEWLKQRDVFSRMGVVDGVPQLVLGSGRDKADPVSLAVFCKVVFDYFAELDPKYTQMIVIDGVTGQRVAVVDARGTHYN